MEFYFNNMDGNLYISHYNLWYQVQVVFCGGDKADELANQHMEQNDDSSVLVSEGGVVILVNKNDKGQEII